MKNSSSMRSSGTYTSPPTPEYGDYQLRGFQKGWCSERVPLPSNNSRRYISATALMPFNSGRTVPSKWDDAERWITSPMSGYGTWKTPTAQLQRRPKSKSGPLGTPGLMNSSPSLTLLEDGNMSNFVTNSPFSTGVLVPDGVSIHYGDGVNSMARTTSVPGLSDLFIESSVPSSEDDEIKEPDSVSRRDMATQMSTHSSSQASPNDRSSSIPSGVEHNTQFSTKDEIRDVQVDKGAPISGQSLKSQVRKPRKNETFSRWDVADAAKSMSKSEREEARITAWENLQKAKAEAAIQKLEMKLEKRRSASMDRILNELKFSQLKAQEMRHAISEGHSHRPEGNPRRINPSRKCSKIASFSSCFICGEHNS